MSLLLWLSRKRYRFLSWLCDRVGHDWSEYSYSESPEHQFTRHSHRHCYRCSMSSSQSGLAEFPPGVWVERYVCTEPDRNGYSKIVRIERRLTPRACRDVDDYKAAILATVAERVEGMIGTGFIDGRWMDFDADSGKDPKSGPWLLRAAVLSTLASAPTEETK